jgi:hypothetical protein
MLSRRRLFALSALSPLVLAGGPARLFAKDTVPKPQAAAPDRMATVGIAAGQLARLSVFHHLDQAISPCGFEAILLDVDGKTVASGQGTVSPGRGAFLDFDPAAGLRKGQRLQVHAMVDVPADHAEHVGATLEIFDGKTGKTAMTIGPCGVRAPLAGMGTVGVVDGQAARVSLFHHDDGAVGPCGYQVDLLGLDGAVLGSNKGQLLPGQGAFHDYDLAAGLKRGESVQFHAMVRVPIGHALGALVEVFDARTAVTECTVVPCGVEDPTLGQ